MYLSSTVKLFFYSFTDYTAIYQQQQAAHRAQQNYCTVGIESLSWGNYKGKSIAIFLLSF